MKTQVKLYHEFPQKRILDTISYTKETTTIPCHSLWVVLVPHPGTPCQAAVDLPIPDGFSSIGLYCLAQLKAKGRVEGMDVLLCGASGWLLSSDRLRTPYSCCLSIEHTWLLNRLPGWKNNPHLTLLSCRERVHQSLRRLFPTWRQAQALSPVLF